MNKNPKKTYCVIGDPIGHSLSPQIHNFVFKNLNLLLDYEKIQVTPDNLAEFVQETRRIGRPGFNITIPHKELIIPHLDEVDPLAKRVGAVNTVLNREGRLIGFNSDIYGCKTALERNNWTPKGLVILIGAGGAARAVIEALASLGTNRLILFDLIKQRTEKLKNDFQTVHSMDIQVGSLDNDDLEANIKNVDLLINATPVGMWPNIDRIPIPQPELIPSGSTVFDLVPKPLDTLLLKSVRTKGAKTIPGLSMLIAQALAADEIWLNKRIPENIFDKVWKHLLTTLEEND
jgi:shikimate dehydrogenase